jgi:thiosulfate/3-mercaptopyruvate sulfurtransferase
MASISTLTHPPLVTANWLRNQMEDVNIRVVDGSWHLPALRRNPLHEFVEKHIPKSVFFDIDEIADTGSSLPHMVPPESEFANHVGALGIRNSDHVVAYDCTGVGSAARVWWMFRLYGHKQVSVLNGGLPAWEDIGEVTCGAESRQPSTFATKFNPNLIRTLDQMRATIKTKNTQILDARSHGRFEGTEREPREGLKSGRIPESFNLPFLELYNPETKLLLPAEKLSKLLAEAGINPKASIVTSCGSGVTACNLALALYVTGNTTVAVYDGSWTEWGGRNDTPVEQ